MPEEPGSSNDLAIAGHVRGEVVHCVRQEVCVKEGERERERARRFDALYQSYSADMVAYCKWRAGSVSDAQDAVAEVFMTAWRRLDDVPAGEAARVWLYATARRMLANQRRSTRRRAALVERLAVAAPAQRQSSDSEEHIVHEALGRLGSLD